MYLPASGGGVLPAFDELYKLKKLGRAYINSLVVLSLVYPK
jgi:hypothetical protein